MNYKNQSVEIRISRKKIFLLLAGSVILFLIGIWIVFGNPATEDQSRFNSVKITIAGYASIFFFGLTTIALAKKSFRSSPALLIDNVGITDHSSAVSAGFISWSDIENISRFEIRGQKFIMIQVKDPESFIQKQNSPLKRKAMSLNNRLYGTPITISANALEIGFEELYGMIRERVSGRY